MTKDTCSACGHLVDTSSGNTLTSGRIMCLNCGASYLKTVGGQLKRVDPVEYVDAVGPKPMTSKQLILALVLIWVLVVGIMAFWLVAVDFVTGS